jgi:TPR repeat protein
MLMTGRGVDKNMTEAIRLYRLAIDQGNTAAMNNLGYQYELGEGVPQDHVEAVRLYRMASDQGSKWAGANLGEMMAYGRGTPKNMAESVRLNRLALADDMSLAYKHFGAFHAEGLLQPQDLVLALALMTRAKQLDNDEAFPLVDQYRQQMTPDQIRQAEALLARMTDGPTSVQAMDDYLAGRR